MHGDLKASSRGKRDSLLELLKDEKDCLQTFADDPSLATSDNFLDMICDRMKLILQVHQRWYLKNRLTEEAGIG